MTVNILAKAKSILAACDNDRDAALNYISSRAADETLVDFNEQARILGWQQAFRTVHTADRHTAPGSSEKYCGPGRVNGSATFSSSPRSSTPPRPINPAIASGQKMAEDFATQYVKQATLYGGKVSQANATRGDYDTSIGKYAGIRDSADTMVKYQSDCRELLPKGSVTATHTPEQYPLIYDLAQKHGVI